MADRDKCEDTIASDEGKALLNHRKTRVTALELALSVLLQSSGTRRRPVVFIN